jgi:hypothetical protein
LFSSLQVLSWEKKRGGKGGDGMQMRRGLVGVLDFFLLYRSSYILVKPAGVY